ncbi:MAG TPA: DinB family protein [Thermoanaerobaculia bacterium]|nr:DinB family protein [Thermoanaerobaculia bacterium]
MTKTYRRGPVGALMDEYERAAGELAALIKGISDEEYERVRDETAEEDFRSIQTILTHVVSVGYGHAGMMRTSWGLERRKRWHELFPRNESRSRLTEMLAYTSETLDGKWDLSEEDAEALRIQSGWGTVYDLEQFLEHMVVHILRHRRQIERFLGRPQSF